MVPLQRHGRGRLSSLSNCYTSLYAPLVAAGAPLVETAWLLGRELGGFCRAWPSIRLDALPSEWVGMDGFIAGLADAGLAVRRFADFGNWHETLRGRSWPEYLASRAGGLRELLRRKTRQATRRGGLEFEVISEMDALARGITAYEAVYGCSWKPPEPYPRFNPGLMREAARCGALRLAVAWRGEHPAAAQMWIVANGRATVMKLAHDEADGALSPGTLLTAWMVQQLIGDGIEALDFGRGDDPYKQLWASERRQRIGLMLYNPRRPRGLAALAWHDAGAATRPLRYTALARSGVM
ncbi:MAG TPA: GNAT family N-acetyltransferase [Stellaceae bacterium]|nr:GNAT family N-acetyltransferase [Stellaceae bacterium]